MTKLEKKDVIFQFLRQISIECASHKCCDECPIKQRGGLCADTQVSDESILTTIDIILGDDMQEDTVETAATDQNSDTDAVVQFLRRWGRICIKDYQGNSVGCDACHIKGFCRIGKSALSHTDKIVLQEWVQLVNEQGRFPSYYDDFMEKHPNVQKDFYEQICRNVIYKGRWDCPRKKSRTTQDCKSCWDEEMEDEE